MERKTDQIKKIFYTVLIGSLFIFAVSIVLTHYESLRLYLWKAGSSFYDFFISLKGNVYWRRAERYARGDSYPPLANLFYMLITRLMSVDTLTELLDWKSLAEVQALQECSLYFVLYMNILLLFYYLVCTKWKKGSRLEKNVFAIAMLFTVPFLYQFERANLIFLVMTLTMLFLAWKDEKNPVLRELSYVSLAAAAGMKLYPAIFGLLLIREKKYKEAARLTGYGIALFVLPFVCFDGIGKGLRLYFHNVANASENFAISRIGCQLDYVTILKNAFSGIGGNSIFLANVCLFLFLFLGIWAILGLQQSWKAILLMSCMVIGVPSISYVYTAIFMILPIIAYLNSEEKEKKDLIYLIGMLLVVIPLPFGWKEVAGDRYYTYMHVTVPVWVEGLSIVFMTVLLIFEGLAKFIRKKAVFSLTGIVLIVLVSVVANRGKYNAPYAFTNYLTKTLSGYVEVQDGAEIVQSFTANRKHLDSITLHYVPPKDGKIIVSVEKASDGTIIDQTEFQSEKKKGGYYEIDFGDCTLETGTRYVLRVSVDAPKNKNVKFWKTIPYLDTGEEYFKVNGESKEGALAVRFVEAL